MSDAHLITLLAVLFAAVCLCWLATAAVAVTYKQTLADKQVETAALWEAVRKQMVEINRQSDVILLLTRRLPRTPTEAKADDRDGTGGPVARPGGGPEGGL